MDGTAVITVCETCSFAPDEKTRDGVTGGEVLAGLVEAVAAGRPGLAVRRHACLMGCERHCNVAVSAPGKVSYVLGRFEPVAESAEAVVAYAEKYAASETGVVRYREWPEGVKGHFTARIPPLPTD